MRRNADAPAVEGAPIKTGGEAFLRLPEDDAPRILARAVFEAVDAGGFCLRMDRPHPDLESGGAVIVYYQREGRFVQQLARVRGLPDGVPAERVELAPAGDPICADHRRHRRTPVSSECVQVELDGVAVARVLDVSPSGLAVVTDLRLLASQELTARLELDGEGYEGRVTVRSFRALDEGRNRYGLRLLDETAETRLCEGLRDLARREERAVALPRLLVV